LLRNYKYRNHISKTENYIDYKQFVKEYQSRNEIRAWPPRSDERGPGANFTCTKECFPGADGEPIIRKVQCYGQIALQSKLLGGGRFTVKVALTVSNQYYLWTFEYSSSIYDHFCVGFVQLNRRDEFATSPGHNNYQYHTITLFIFRQGTTVQSARTNAQTG
jgi:hypothetical protein